MVPPPPATAFWEICRSKPCLITLATPTVNRGAKISFVSKLSRTDNGYMYTADY